MYGWDKTKTHSSITDKVTIAIFYKKKNIIVKLLGFLSNVKFYKLKGNDRL